MPNSLKGVAKKLGIPQKKLIETVKNEMEWDVETVDEIVTKFKSSLDHFVDKIAVKSTEKIMSNKRFWGYTSEEQKALVGKVYKICFGYAMEWLNIMYGDKNELHQV